MRELPPPRSERRPLTIGRVATWLLIILGIGFLAVPFITRASFSRPQQDQPGELIALVDVVTWRSPSDIPLRSLANNMAKARFQVKNVGERPVEIVATESSCGCATPSVEPRKIAPGVIGTVDVAATALAVGERTATITLRTDSVVTPTVVLRLKIVGSREPPFISVAQGDVTFDDETAFGESRELFVHTAEWKGSEPSPPATSGGFPGLMILPGRLYSAKASASPNAVVRSYLYEARLEKPYPNLSQRVGFSVLVREDGSQ